MLQKWTHGCCDSIHQDLRPHCLVMSSSKINKYSILARSINWDLEVGSIVFGMFIYMSIYLQLIFESKHYKVLKKFQQVKQHNLIPRRKKKEGEHYNHWSRFDLQIVIPQIRGNKFYTNKTRINNLLQAFN